MTIVQKQHQSVVFLASEEMEQAGGVAHGFSTRLGGISEGMWASLNLGVSRGDDSDHVRENYRRFLTAIGAQGPRMAMSNQVHENHVRVITKADVKEDPYEKVSYEADGLVTDLPGVTLVIFSADCLPILYYDPVRQVVAAAHAGWRGTAADIAGAVVRKMEEVYGCDPQNILAAIGPGIGPCCFETHEDVPNAMMAAFSTPVLKYLHIQENGKYSVDLKGINAMRLEKAGIPTENIGVCELCTSCHPDLFWSHRQVGTNRGSMAAAIGLK